VHGKPSPWLSIKEEGSFEDRFNSGDRQILLWELDVLIISIKMFQTSYWRSGLRAARRFYSEPLIQESRYTAEAAYIESRLYSEPLI
jgi:hypothetical protein